ncbi:hypothetical protein [Arcobacter arenosus]|uniref:Uncharacterized protein n=1 Tax=Arcobacter arenosus TaxID=2576037 RepID=A0A5R8Y5E8_9BACT|nr:hypothetical protein [Arcobacter arenosus]TLP41061.1 hypothetical protein FDK22_03305 [Arcobacter arenosus]
MKKIMIITLMSIVSLFGDWKVQIDKDEMTGKIEAFAHSEFTYPTKKMDFPYASTKAWLAVGCDKINQWAYIGFTVSPNIVNTTAESGYSTFKTRVKFDDKVETASMSKDWGSKFIHFSYDKWAIQNLKKSKKMLLELNWHGNGRTYFNFSLDNAENAINAAIEKCKGN